MTSGQASGLPEPTTTIVEIVEERVIPGADEAPGVDEAGDAPTEVEQPNSTDPAESSEVGQVDEGHERVAGEPAADVRSARGFGRKRLAALIAVLLLLGCGGGFYAIFGQADTKPPAEATHPPASYDSYTDPSLGYRIAYPGTWRQTADGQGGILLQAGGQDAVNIREFTLNHSVDPGSVPEMQAVTNAVLSTPDAHLAILASQQVSVGGVPGIYYLYYFTSGGVQGVHGHYFLFRGRQMFTIVVQALPASDFQHLAPTFDSIVQSFKLTH